MRAIAELRESDFEPLRPIFGSSEPREVVERDDDRDDVADLPRAEFALRFVSADSRETWLRTGMALRASGDEGRRVWDAWSRTSRKFDEADQDRTWASFDTPHENRPTLASIFALADKADKSWRREWDKQQAMQAFTEIAAEDAAGTGAAPPAPRPMVTVAAGETHELLAQVERNLVAHPAGADVFQRGGQVVRVVRTTQPLHRRGVELPAEMLRILSVSAAWLAPRFEASSNFVKPGKDGQPRPVGCPAKLPEHFLANAGAWTLRPLTGIITAPTLRPDGSILQTPGFDAQTGLLFEPGAATFPAVPASPTRDDALAALAKLREPVRLFPFVAESDVSAWLASVLTSLIRYSLPTAPLFTFNAPVMGSGKSMLADVVSLVATGHAAPCMAPGGGEDETRKVVLSLLMSGAQLAVIDNVAEPLDSATIASVLTQETLRGRVLGESRTIDVPTCCTWLCTGNNLVIVGDLIRRVIPCDLDPGVERPDARHFEFDPRAFARDHRGELVAAALTILRAFEVAGRPGVDALQPFGSFEPWSAAVRAPLVWLGLADPLLGRLRLQEHDPVVGLLGRLLPAWHEAFLDRPRTVREVVAAARGGGADPLTTDQARALSEALAELVGSDRLETEVLRVGQQLARYRDRIVGGLRLVARNGARGTRSWLVTGSTEGLKGLGGVPSDRRPKSSCEYIGAPPPAAATAPPGVVGNNPSQPLQPLQPLTAAGSLLR